MTAPVKQHVWSSGRCSAAIEQHFGIAVVGAISEVSGIEGDYSVSSRLNDSTSIIC
jgi:hypothetical protein